MIQIVLHRSELLVLLDALHTSTIVGIDRGQIAPATPAEQRAAVAQGHELLARRGLLREKADGEHALDSTLLLLGAVLAFPQLAALTIRRSPAGETLRWHHYYSDGLIVERSQPDAEHHHLVTLPGPAALTARLLDLWPTGPAPAVSCTLPADGLAAIVAALDSEDDAEAQRLADLHDLPVPARGRLLNALARRRYGGNTALLRCDGATVSAARNPGFIVGPRDTWLVTPLLAGSTLLRLEPIDGPQLQRRLTGWLQTLYPLQRAA